MYLVGAEHPNKRDTITLLESLVSERERLVTNTEVLQEILHRYTAIHRKEAIQPAFDAIYDMVDDIFEVTERDVLEAKNVILAYENLSARDALHTAHMRRMKIGTIFSFDAGFDFLGEFKRVPAKF